MQEITTLANIQCVPCMKDLFHRVVAVPSAVFFRTLSVPIWAPYIWYQNVNRRQDVGGILGLWKQATSPFSAGADASKNKYLPVHEKGQQEWISFEKFDGGAPAHDRGAPASVALYFHRWKKNGGGDWRKRKWWNYWNLASINSNFRATPQASELLKIGLIKFPSPWAFWRSNSYSSTISLLNGFFCVSKVTFKF